MPTEILPLLYALVLGYLCGSIPFGLILTRAAGLGDIRAIGSGNIGATNVLRTGNKGLAAGTLVLDALKAVIPVLLARHFWGEDAARVAALGAFLGHCFPVWLGFKGGKGVAVMIGSLLALNWIVGLIFCAVWLLIAFTRKISSLAALTAAATAPIFAYVLGSERLALVVTGIALLLFFQHRENIARLIKGTEPSIGGGRKAA
ncbi:glycerol-3-phosphate 1-O-acyltransferase PlsY [Devosia sp. 63-57]|uniref:glycerol-3-phosphate 1-O-acyltransferase PlsY n=1 Tax=Devosia sp. 63-57 TaxID=1895751 RepID=UPI00086C4B56|nr:glycerol-3-phosphate 1-O-acyltransferase PlsY [Devosia sp. 63-57]ODT49279.1 MAG: glycerol-3-phosphate acyltransferase [Pelagibacterium sp. SCN 63-126]ODU82250.1 MAG: glycerol-3-phosphate acyltransferase [Pelagibacterium sp. SCN 63-17]OJX43418.1 MAG: glycerol-3-phosphate acyltransferase [Devosia sp. 63-57]